MLIPTLISFKRQISLICQFLLLSLKTKTKRKKKSYYLLAHEIIKTSAGLVKVLIM
jgi:hypothetical protein